MISVYLKKRMQALKAIKTFLPVSFGSMDNKAKNELIRQRMHSDNTNRVQSAIYFGSRELSDADFLNLEISKTGYYIDQYENSVYRPFYGVLKGRFNGGLIVLYGYECSDSEAIYVKDNDFFFLEKESACRNTHIIARDSSAANLALNVAYNEAQDTRLFNDVYQLYFKRSQKASKKHALVNKLITNRALNVKSNKSVLIYKKINKLIDKIDTIDTLLSEFCECSAYKRAKIAAVHDGSEGIHYFNLRFKNAK